MFSLPQVDRHEHALPRHPLATIWHVVQGLRFDFLFLHVAMGLHVTTTASKGLPLFYIIARLWQTSSTRFEPDHLRHEQARTARGGAHQPSMYERTSTISLQVYTAVQLLQWTPSSSGNLASSAGVLPPASTSTTSSIVVL